MSIEVRVYGASRVARSLERLSAELEGIVSQEFKSRLGPRLVSRYRAFAPKKTGRLASRIAAEEAGARIDITSTVRSDEGFPYTASTRFGRGPVFPKRAQALRFEIAGRVIFAKSVGPYKPPEDWARVALPGARNDVTASAGRISRRLNP